jgi:hypothetical protein
MQKLDHCSADPEGTAEAYLLDSLPRNEARAFEEHYIDCPGCAAILRQTAEFVVRRKRAAQRLRESRSAVRLERDCGRGYRASPVRDGRLIEATAPQNDIGESRWKA